MADQSSDLPTLYLVDGSGFIFRAFHALPPMTRPDGTPVNAVFGFTNMLLKLATDFHAGQIAVVFDAERKNFRNDIYAEYKANRDEPPEELIPQFALIREAAEAFGLPAMELEGYEADDLIATYARQAQARGQKVVIVSSDKDLMQLVDDGIVMYDPIKLKEIGPAEVEEKFGVPPAKVTEVQALAGDNIDNIPGIPGIGVKTAAQLIQEYGDLETLLSNAARIKQPKRRERLTEHADAARVSLKLVKLDEAVPVPIKLDDLPPPKLDSDRSLLAFAEANAFKSIVRRLQSEAEAGGGSDSSGGGPALGGKAAQGAATDAEKAYELVQDKETLQAWVDRLYEARRFAFDTETDGLIPSVAPLIGISIAVAAGQACYIPLGHEAAPKQELNLNGNDKPKQIDPKEAARILRPVFEDPRILKVAHNAKFDYQVLKRHLGIDTVAMDDTMLLSYCLDGTQHAHGLDALAADFLGLHPIGYTDVCGTGKQQIPFSQVTLDNALDYAAEDADIALRLHHLLRPRLAPERATRLYQRIERPLIPVLADMEAAGIRVDPQILQRMSRDFAERIGALEGEIHAMAGRPVNIGSPKQLSELLFDEMGLDGGKKTKSGAKSTSADVLEKLAAEGHEIVQKILDHRQLSKLKSTYTDALQEAIQEDGRVHTSFSMTVTNTGRLSSSDPNLQNIPIRTEEGRKIRTAFVAEQGKKLLSVDYSQIELRIVADVAGIDALKQAFIDGEDIHARTASEVFGIPMDQMTGEIRRQAKAINFGIIYGISGWGLAQQLGVTPQEANGYIGQYLQKYWQLGDYMERTKAFARGHGYVETRGGRKIYLPSIKDKNQARRSFAERQAINAPIQGLAAEIMKKAMIRVHRMLAERANLKATMLLQVHDELVFEVPEQQADEAAAAIRSVMEGAAALEVPLIAEAGTGDSWAQAH